jgi:hypothetical protein
MKKAPIVASRLLTIDASAVCVLLALGAGAYFLGVEPVLSARAKIQEQKQLLEEQARNAAGQESLIVVQQKKLADVAATLKTISVPLFPPREINKRLSKITELADTHNLKVEQQEAGQARPAAGSGELGKFTVVPIRIVGTGSFDGIAGFLHQLLGTEYPDVEVRSMIVNAPAEGQADAAFAIDLRWYAAPAASTASAADQTQK